MAKGSMCQRCKWLAPPFRQILKLGPDKMVKLHDKESPKCPDRGKGMISMGPSN